MISGKYEMKAAGVNPQSYYSAPAKEAHQEWVAFVSSDPGIAGTGHSPSVGSKPFVKYYFTLRETAVKRESKKHFRGNAFEAQAGNISKAEFRVILRVSDQAAAPGAQGLQAGQAFPDQGCANSLTLEIRQHRDGPQPVPTRRAVRYTYRRKGNMPDHPAVHLGDERKGQGPRSPQSFDDVLLRVAADFKSLKGGGRHGSDGRRVRRGFIADQNSLFFQRDLFSGLARASRV